MTRTWKIFLSSPIVAFLAICGSYSQQANDPMSAATSGSTAGATNSTDTRFVKQAAEGGMAEVALGQLAVDKASSGDVKKFGQRMVDDHSKANGELKELAAQKNIDIPQSLNSKDQATKASLEKLSGAEFDQAYMRDMVQDHRKDISDFRRESTSAQDPDIKKFVRATLPTLEDHLKQAEAIAPRSPMGGR
jgi:putative membrane protein